MEDPNANISSARLNKLVQVHKSFIQDCKLVEEERFPEYPFEVTWYTVPVKTQFEANKAVALSEFPDNLRNSMWMDVRWKVSLDLLPAMEKDSLSIPYDKDKIKSPSSNPNAGGDKEGSVGKRLAAFTVRAIRGLDARSSHRLSEHIPEEPQFVLVATVSWEGPAEDGFTVSAASVTIGEFEIKAREPLSMYNVSPHSFILDSASALHWNIGYMQNRGTETRSDWLQDRQGSGRMFVDTNSRGSRQQRSYSSVKLSLTVRLNENSIPRLGFPFQLLTSVSLDDFNAVLNEAQRPRADCVRVHGLGAALYFIPKDVLMSLSGYFRTFLKSWPQVENGQLSVAFPQVDIFNDNPEVTSNIVYYFARQSRFPGLSENSADLIIAADALEMPELMDLAQTAAISNITIENVVRLILLAWDFRALVLFRAALIFLKSNYDDVWVRNRTELVELGSRLSTPDFVKVFQMQPFTQHERLMEVDSIQPTVSGNASDG